MDAHGLCIIHHICWLGAVALDVICSHVCVSLRLKQHTDFPRCSISNGVQHLCYKTVQLLPQSVCLTLSCTDRNMLSLMEREDVTCVVDRAVETQSRTALVTPTTISLSCWEGMLRKVLGGGTQKPCRTLGTISITTSRSGAGRPHTSEPGFWLHPQ